MTTSGHDGPQHTSNPRFFSEQAPTTTGFLRGLVEAVIAAALSGALVYFEAGAEYPPEMVGFIPVIVVLLRTAEGYIDSTR
jgi:hypothetical protein